MWQPINASRADLPRPQAPISQTGESLTKISSLPTPADEVRFSGLRDIRNKRGPDSTSPSSEVQALEEENAELRAQTARLKRELQSTRIRLAKVTLDRYFGDEPGLQVHGDEVLREVITYEQDKLVSRKAELTRGIEEAKRDGRQAKHLFDAAESLLKEYDGANRWKKKDILKDLKPGVTIDSIRQTRGDSKATIDAARAAIGDKQEELEYLQRPNARAPFTLNEIQERFPPARRQAVAEAVAELEKAYLFNRPEPDSDKLRLSSLAFRVHQSGADGDSPDREPTQEEIARVKAYFESQFGAEGWPFDGEARSFR